MPRITPVRVLKALLLPWIVLVGLWLFLPSPTISGHARDYYIQDHLRKGGAVTTIHKWDSSCADEVAPNRYRSPPDNCQGVIIPWRLVSDERSDSVSLEVGQNLRLSINLTQALLRTTTNQPSQEFAPFLSSKLDLKIDLGDTDHIINMPWFNWADQVLFHNQMHNFDYSIPLRVLAPTPDTVEIWKDVKILRDYPKVELRDGDREFGMLASFSGIRMFPGTRANIAHIKVHVVKGLLPSKTYSFRHFILLPLAPALVVALFLLEVAILPVVVPILAGYSLVVLIIWACLGFPNFREWSANFVMTRWCCGGNRRPRDRKPRFWGPAGPVLDERDELLYDLENDVHDMKTRGSKHAKLSLFDEFNKRLWGPWTPRKADQGGGRFRIPK